MTEGPSESRQVVYLQRTQPSLDVRWTHCEAVGALESRTGPHAIMGSGRRCHKLLRGPRIRIVQGLGLCKGVMDDTNEEPLKAFVH